MKLNSKGQVTIPAELRRKHSLHEGDEVDIIDDEGRLTVVRRAGAQLKAAGSYSRCGAGRPPSTAPTS